MQDNKFITYSNPLLFDFTTLDNYVAPENTMEAENPDWANAKSCFYSLGEYHIFSEACIRRAPDEIEIKRIEFPFDDIQYDVLLSAKMSDLIPLDKKEKKILKELNIAAFFRYKSNVHPRGIHGLAVVYNNNLVFIS